MLGRQARVIEALQRTLRFVETHVPANAGASYAKHARGLAAAVRDIEQLASGQSGGRRRRAASTKALHAAETVLRERHLKPLAMIGQALSLEYHFESALRMPRRRRGVTYLLAEAASMRTCAERHARVLIDNGRPPDFLAQLDAAVETVRSLSLEQARELGQQVGSTAGLAQVIDRARRLVTMLECQVVALFADDAVLLAEWRAAKRVQLKTGVKAAVAVEHAVTEAVTAPVREVLLLEAPKLQMLITAKVREKVAA